MKDTLFGSQNAIELKPFAADRDNVGKIYIASVDFEKSHCNLYVPKRRDQCICMQPSEAKKLRDLLIAAYPIEAVQQKPQYAVSDDPACGFFHVQVQGSRPSNTVVAKFVSKADAEAFVASKQ